MDTPNLNEITDLAAKQKLGNQSFLQGQNALSSDFLNRYTGAINSQEGSAAMASRIGSELGIPTLQKNATMLRNTLTNLPSTYNKATTGYDVNANQLSRIIGQKSSELAPAVTTAENSLSSANNTLGTQMGYQQADQAKALVPYQTEQQMLSDRLARETTMYTNENQNELNALITKIQTGVTLSEGEKNRANALAVSEQNYQNALKTQKSAPDGTQIVEIGGVKKLINSKTGAVISTYGSTTGGSANDSEYYGTTTGTSNGSTQPSPNFVPFNPAAPANLSTMPATNLSNGPINLNLLK